MATIATATTIGSASEPAPATRLEAKDKATIALLGLFILVAWTLELYWLIHHNNMEGRQDLLARLLQIYWPADRTYRIAGYGADKAFTLALESVNTLATQWLQVWLIYAIVKGKTYRHVLQLTVATYTWYGTFLYFYVAHLSGYAVVEHRGLYPLALFYGINAPWFIAYAWFMYESIAHLVQQGRAGGLHGRGDRI
jgi:hypothetical protein